MNVVDSSGWLEYFAGGLNGRQAFAPAIHHTDEPVVPTVCIFEVFKRILAQQGEEEALAALGWMRRGQCAGSFPDRTGDPP